MRSLAIALLLLAALPAAAQPSADQLGAVRSNCRGDFIEHCAGVPRGGTQALNCLRQNESSLGAACRQALAAIGATGPGQAPAPGGLANAPAGGNAYEMFREECGADVQRLCQGVRPGGGRVMACLSGNVAELSAACRGAMQELRSR